ncbi:aminoglycoside N(3)-acetyltransferase [Asanoa siamensis]|uniref:Aminoglycoside N(3)-acetyltransferase n=1 Tax=Asanoa siamensis TaxID=926357 RepID=A0ABQ4CLW8_9ACTN|nr:AAC(3) family N-acetyltransferase [Asanoa siamensis]GIF72268.1 AAC(3) family N-acetyltransferase [Asanoa siamensis]
MTNHPSEAAQRLPHTRESLAADLTALGVRPGSTLLVHASLKPVGYVAGGPHAIVLALRDALGPDGTLVVPTHTPDNSDPAGWQNPPVPEDWWPVIRDNVPGFDPAVTPSRWMGAIAEVVRTWPGAQRSDHPQVSFAALGRLAGEVVAGQPRAGMLGPDSPLGKVYGLDGDVLLLGVGHDSNTSLHLAEYRQESAPPARLGAAVQTADGGRDWVWWDDVDLDEGDFELLGADFEATGAATVGRVGGAMSRLMSQRAAVDFADRWMAENRKA